MKTMSGPVTMLAIKASPCQAPQTKYRETMERLLTIDDIAEKLQVKKSTIYALVHRNRIPHIKLTGKLLRFRETEIQEWIDRVTSCPTSSQDNGTKKEKKRNGKYCSVERLIENARREVLLQ